MKCELKATFTHSELDAKLLSSCPGMTWAMFVYFPHESNLNHLLSFSKQTNCQKQMQKGEKIKEKNHREIQCSLNEI
jgi:hypothetical protein